MIAIISLLITVTLSMLVTRVAAMALMLTGLSRETARFQARSAFTGVGFTTSESESILDHPVRRRIIYMLMLVGNIGVATVVAALMLSVIDSRQTTFWMYNLTFLLVGLIFLWIISSSRYVERHLNRLISWALRKFSKLEVRDYVAVLNLQNGYAVTEMQVNKQDWMAGKTLLEMKLSKEGVLILGVQRVNGSYLGAPTAKTEVHAGEKLVLYGPIERIKELDQRRKGRKGEAAHEHAKNVQVEVLQQQNELEISTTEGDLK